MSDDREQLPRLPFATLQEISEWFEEYAKPESTSKDRLWVVTSTGDYDKFEDFLSEGWEPFSVTVESDGGNTFWLKTQLGAEAK